MKKRIAIIGSGIAGLTIANLFKQNSDFEFMVYEKSDRLSLEAGFGIQLAVNSISILNKIGFNKINLEKIYQPERLNFYSIDNGWHTQCYDRSKNNYSTRKDLNPTYSLFNQRSDKHAGALLALCILDKADVLKNGIVSSNIEEFDVASTWKDIVNTQVVDTDWMRDFIFPSFKHEKYIEMIMRRYIALSLKY